MVKLNLCHANKPTCLLVEKFHKKITYSINILSKLSPFYFILTYWSFLTFQVQSVRFKRIFIWQLIIGSLNKLMNRSRIGTFMYFEQYFDSRYLEIIFCLIWNIIGTLFDLFIYLWCNRLHNELAFIQLKRIYQFPYSLCFDEFK